MRATATVDGDIAMVELRPCWLARWLGARTVRIHWDGDRKNVGRWKASVTGESLVELPYHSKILRALDFQPVEILPVARIVVRKPE